MYSIVIVEDENTIMQALKSFVNWSEIGYEIVGTFENGKEAFEYISKNNVNVVLTDVKMPVMDGMQLIKQLFELNKDIKAIVLSGYDEFEYAQSSIRYNVFDYILKPVDFNMLSNTFKRLKDKLDKEWNERYRIRESNSIRIEQYLNNLVKGALCSPKDIYNEAISLGIDISSGSYCICRTRIKSYFCHDDFSDNKKLLKLSIMNVVNEIFNSTFNFYTFCDDVDSFCILIKEAESVEKIKNTLKQVKTCIAQFLNKDIVSGISSYYNDITSCAKAYKEATISLQYNFIYPEKDIFYPEIKKKFSSKLSVLTKQDWDNAFKYLRMKNVKAMEDLIMNKFSNVPGQEDFLEYIHFQYIEFILLFERFCQETGLNSYDVSKQIKKIDEFESFDQVKEFIITLFNSLMDKKERKCNSHAKIINRVKEYIEQHYGENLTLLSISEYIYMNPSYFSRIFKQVTGINFNHYVSEVRIKKASELLKDSNIKVYEIGEMVGYNDYGHFNDTFKKIMGMTASEYRDTIRQKIL